MYVYIIIFSFLASLPTYILSFDVEAKTVFFPRGISHRDNRFYEKGNVAENISVEGHHNIKKVALINSKDNLEITEGEKNLVELNALTKKSSGIKKKSSKSKDFKGTKLIRWLTGKNSLSSRRNARLERQSLKTADFVVLPSDHHIVKQSVNLSVKSSFGPLEKGDIHENVLTEYSLHAKQLGKFGAKLGGKIIGAANKIENFSHNKSSNVQSKKEDMILVEGWGFKEQVETTLFAKKKVKQYKSKLYKIHKQLM